MKKTAAPIVLLAILVCAVSCADRAPAKKITDFVYQYSIMDALLAGVYDGNMTFGELKKHGDFGLGGFNTLDGELIMNHNEVYKMRYDGSIHAIPDADRTGIAFVKFFRPDSTFAVHAKGLTYDMLKDSISKRIARNSIYAIRITGKLKAIQARAPHPATKPYPPLAEYLATGGQYNFDFENVSGTLVGFYMPDYMEKTNIPGFHTHFITDDRKQGGHIFDFVTDEPLTVEVDQAEGIIIAENTHPDWQKLNLKENRQSELHRVE
ncbi:acetolactate decarboxylase [Parapedobacter sp. GCM10030251]|uniref:acetolactate decarboxylase n=1 Tax=Parapedobacter sp. GCM10030251 TaxID=3273419 RepID=UPI00360FE47E